MPIKPIVLQRRHAELGRIRLGNQVATQNGGTRPNKLDKFRFTSASERFITELATLYGGEARPWDNNGKPEWEVFTEAQSIPMIVVKGGLSQWMETWSGGGCVHRCDGEQQVDGTVCDPNDPKHQNAKPTTRLSGMLPELEAIGVWRLESHGWNAAAEIPAIAELAQFVGDLVPANLHLMERRVVKDGKTSRFVVPVLDLQIGTARLKQLVAERSGIAALPSGSGPAALQAGPSQPELRPPTLEDIQAAATEDDVFRMFRFLEFHKLLTPELDAACKARVDAFRSAAPAPAPAAGPDEEGVYEAEIVDDPDAVWLQILKATGEQGMTESQTKEAYETFSGGTAAGVASAAELQAFLKHLAGEQVPA